MQDHCVPIVFAQLLRNMSCDILVHFCEVLLFSFSAISLRTASEA